MMQQQQEEEQQQQPQQLPREKGEQHEQNLQGSQMNDHLRIFQTVSNSNDDDDIQIVFEPEMFEKQYQQQQQQHEYSMSASDSEDDFDTSTTTSTHSHTHDGTTASVSTNDSQTPVKTEEQTNGVLLNLDEIPIEKKLMNDILLDDGEMAPAREYQSIELDEQLTGFWAFLKNWWHGRGEKYWQQHFFFIIHVIYIVCIGLFYGVIVFILERNNTKWNLLDSIFNAFSALCLSGFIVQPIDQIHGSTQFILWLSMVSGGLSLTAIPPLLVKIHRARKRMLAKRAEQLLKLRNSMAANARILIDLAEKEEKENRKKSKKKRKKVKLLPIPSMDNMSDINSDDLLSDQSIHTASETMDHTEHPEDSFISLQLDHMSSPHHQRSLSNTPSEVDHRRLSMDSVTSIDQMISNSSQDYTGIARATQQQSPSNTNAGLRNYFEATHLDPSTFKNLPENVKSYFSSASFDLKHFNPANWPDTVKNYFADNASYDYFESIPFTDIEYTALVWLLVLTVCLIVFVNLAGLMILGIELSMKRDLLDGNNPWWIALFITTSSFNNVGMMLFSDNLSRFVHNATVCIVVGILILVGNTCMPIALRLIIYICYNFSKQYKLVFKYMLEKHHHLSLHLFPGLQTRAYAMISLLLLALGIFTPLVLDRNNGAYKDQPFGTKLLISFFHACSSRTGGFQAIDFNVLSMGTLCVYLLMMRIKAQMACGLRENAYKIMDVVRQLNSSVSEGNIDTTAGSDKNLQTNQVQSTDLGEIIKNLPEDMIHRDKTKKGELVIVVKEVQEEEESTPTVDKVFSFSERSRNFLHKLWKHLLYHTRSLFGSNNAWLTLLVFTICVSESQAAIANPNITVFKIVFEVVSGFCNVGLSMGMPGSPLAFSAALNNFSKVMIILSMVTGRHRGFYGSMVDQQEDQYDVQLNNKSLMKQRMRVAARKKKL